MPALVPDSGKGERVVVAMSGGVDSSVAALLLKQAGYDVVGVTMRLFAAPSNEAARLNRSCCSIEDVADARAVCRAIGARHYLLNFEREFKRHVIDYFVSEYAKGRTPYPCLACNDRLKFDFLLERAAILDAKFIATGHYARIARNEESGGSARLLKGVDPAKDQSYVLYTLSQAQLSKLFLPVGRYSKPEIREIARDAGLPVADKPDSQDICFVPDGDYREFVGPRLEMAKPGLLVGPDGEVLGEHDGVHNFTIGQRRGLGLNGGGKRPLFVTEIDAESGTVVLGHAESLLRSELFASSPTWVSGEPPRAGARVAAKIRYKSPESAATLWPIDGGLRIEFEEPQRAITPGQAVVFFDGDEVLGGGVIELSEAPLNQTPATANVTTA
ncbi:MAG: tRNA 2-thiouridine(34) synthase MnmA [Chloroflexi bacterium]|nr:tRNA 2-thiouridine(34) synthase MnmA [Chloroflexota bacterium]